MIKIKKCLSIAAIMFLINVTTAFGSEDRTDAMVTEKRLIFATPQKEGIFTNYLIRVFEELSNRIGIQCEITELPKKRCLSESNRGLYDGVAARIIGLESVGYKNLIRIKVSHFTVQHIVFSHKASTLNAHNLASLINAAKMKKYIVGYLQGSKKAAELLGELPAENTIALDSPEQAFRMLSSHRINAYLAGPGIVNRSILKHLIQDIPENHELQKIQELFIASESELFPYVHAKHDNLVPVIEKALQSMKAEGALEKLMHK